MSFCLFYITRVYSETPKHSQSWGFCVMSQTMVELRCHKCGVVFQRIKSEHDRCVRRGRNEYCSAECAKPWGNNNYPEGNPGNLTFGRTLDEFSPFRYYRKCIRQRVKRRGVKQDVDLEYLRDLWDEQAGICPLTGWQLTLPIGSCGFNSRDPSNASLDRIDPAQGYIRGNVRYVAYVANLARHMWSDGVVVEFCKAVVDNTKRREVGSVQGKLF